MQTVLCQISVQILAILSDQIRLMHFALNHKSRNVCWFQIGTKIKQAIAPPYSVSTSKITCCTNRRTMHRISGSVDVVIGVNVVCALFISLFLCHIMQSAVIFFFSSVFFFIAVYCFGTWIAWPKSPDADADFIHEHDSMYKNKWVSIMIAAFFV